MTKKSSYTKWTAIIATGVTVLSLAINGFQAYTNYGLEKEKTDMENKLDSLELEKRRLENLARKRELSVDLETRLFFISGMALLKLQTLNLGGEDANSTGVMQTRPYKQLGEWIERWEMGEDFILDDGGTKKAHAVVFLKVTNRGDQDAHKVKLLVRQKDYNLAGEQDAPLWELDTSNWESAEIRLADLEKGQSVLAPTAHILGSSEIGSTYYGRVIVAREIKWFNPTLQQEDSAKVARMAPEDQWISQGLDISVAQ